MRDTPRSENCRDNKIAARKKADIRAYKPNQGIDRRQLAQSNLELNVCSCEDPMRASCGQGRVSLVDRKTSRRIEMTQFARPTPSAADYDSTIIGALELSEKGDILVDKPNARGSMGPS
jgi:hypothetical protein